MNKIPCAHCNLSFDKEMMITETTLSDKEPLTLHFCCKGCQGVYHLLNDKGLESFYQKRGSKTLQPATQLDQELKQFDLIGFKNRYITTTDEGLCEISLIIEGIHCSACVWLNEKVLHQTQGVIEAHINYSTNKAKIIWDEEEIALSKIIETIRAIGYNAYPYDASLQEEHAAKTRKSYYSRILVAIFGAMNIMWLAVAHYAGYFSGIEQSFKNILNVAEFLLATPVLFYSGWIFFRGAYYGYKNNIVNMDTLVASGALSAYIYSIYAMVNQTGEVYFDSVVMIITFVLVGKYFEVLSKKHAVDTLDKLIGSTPTEVMRVDGKQKQMVTLESIVVGDIVELKAGEKVALDGYILQGEGSFDESSLTGESTPQYKQQGDEILSGTLCIDSTLQYKVTKDASHSLLRSIVNLLESSIHNKPKIEQLANTISGYFSTVILLIALFTFAGWYLWSQSFETALIVGISVIVIACPCALGLATPMATLVGINRAAKQGILFKEASFLETMAQSDLLALDKTGTLTQGKPSVLHRHLIHPEDFDASLLLSLVSTSNHPISKGIVKHLQTLDTTLNTYTLEHIKSIEAKGITASYQGKKVLGGSANFLQEHGIEIAVVSEYALFFFAIDQKLIAYFELDDTLKPNAKSTIEKIKHLGIEPIILTGDHEKSANRIATQLGIKQVYSHLLPQEKAHYIQTYQAQGKKVVMVGDGINDSLALASSHIAIAMGQGADIALEVSDVVLLDGKIEAIHESYLLSRRTFRAIKENLAFSILYNVVAIPLAVLGYVNPLVAALSMSLSSLVVVANSLRIKMLRF